MSNRLEASVHLAGQAAKVGLFALIYRASSRYADRHASSITSSDSPASIRSSRGASADASRGPSRSEFLQAMRDLMISDARLVRDGIVPAFSEPSGSLVESVMRLRDMFGDVPKAVERRMNEDRQAVRSEADTDGLPDYFTQNFHYQDGGYLTAQSARLYDLQVETLFSGTAAMMRRQIVRPVWEAVRGGDQRALKLLDVACGTGRLLGELAVSFPRLAMTGLDLSAPYCDEARRHLRARRTVSIVNANAEEIPEPDASYDIVTSAYLFHELPAAVRRTVIGEMARVLKPGGTLVFMDSMQIGDHEPFDGMLERFPDRFHEPYYRNYLGDDLDAAFTDAGLMPCGAWNAFLSKLMVRRRAR